MPGDGTARTRRKKRATKGTWSITVRLEPTPPARKSVGPSSPAKGRMDGVGGGRGRNQRAIAAEGTGWKVLDEIIR